MEYALLKIFWRIFSPGHPRGYIDVFAEETDIGYRAYTKGMKRFDLPDIEIVNIPIEYDLAGYGHGILFSFIGYMMRAKKQNKYIRNGENAGGMFVHDEQTTLHACTIRSSPKISEDGNRVFRIVDIGESLESGFPKKLFAAHLIALASKMKDPKEAETLYRKAIAIYPGTRSYTYLEKTDFVLSNNYNNYDAWRGLGDCLGEQNRHDEALNAYKEAVVRCPQWAEEFTAILVDEMSDSIPESDERKIWDYLTSLDFEAMKKAR